MPTLRLALAQTNPIVGDLVGNAGQILEAARAAQNAGANLLAAGEFSLTGHPLEDLASRATFLTASHNGLLRLAQELLDSGLGDLPVVVGHPDRSGSGAVALGTPIARNCASVLHHGHVKATYAKRRMTSSFIDESRLYVGGSTPVMVRVADVDFAILIGEDLEDSALVSRLADSGAGVILALNAAVFAVENVSSMASRTQSVSQTHDVVVASVTLVGGQDDLVFEGGSIIAGADGTIVARSPKFEQHLLIADVDITGATERAIFEDVTRIALAAPQHPLSRATLTETVAPEHEAAEQTWKALVLGVGDYVRKNGFPSVILGLSGGIDSAVCAVLAADAIGAENVYCVSMPSRYSSDHSRSDAAELAHGLGLGYAVQPIASMVNAFEDQLKLTGLAEENLQARVRAVILMGLSNTHGHLVLSTGNKSEVSVGYSTIYGDSIGGFAPISDVPKTMVWELARWRNAQAIRRGETPPIPVNSIEKAPSAELRPDQKDQDALPPYDVLDGILDAYVRMKLGAADVVALGFDATTVHEVVTLVDRAEWKRRQGAMGPRISGNAFGRHSYAPVTQRLTALP